MQSPAVTSRLMQATANSPESPLLNCVLDGEAYARARVQEFVDAVDGCSAMRASISRIAVATAFDTAEASGATIREHSGGIRFKRMTTPACAASQNRYLGLATPGATVAPLEVNQHAGAAHQECVGGSVLHFLTTVACSPQRARSIRERARNHTETPRLGTVAGQLSLQLGRRAAPDLERVDGR